MEVNKNNTEEIHLAVKWWEKKRFIYNLIALSGGLLVIFVRNEVPNSTPSMDKFLFTCFWLFGANIFYTCSWGSEILMNYYFKANFWKDGLRLLFYILGSLFSFYWMFVLSRETF